MGLERNTAINEQDNVERTHKIQENQAREELYKKHGQELDAKRDISIPPEEEAFNLSEANQPDKSTKDELDDKSTIEDAENETDRMSQEDAIQHPLDNNNQIGYNDDTESAETNESSVPENLTEINDPEENNTVKTEIHPLDNNSIANYDKNESEPAEKETYTKEDLDKLENLENFRPSAINHIFDGEINKRGSANGYHYEGINDSRGAVVEDTKSDLDTNGVYEAKVTVDGIEKSGNDGKSTFFPEYMSPQEVVDSINEAYDNREKIYGNRYQGESKNGTRVEMCLDRDDKIITAYPIYDGGNDDEI